MKGDSALAVVAGVLVGEWDVTGACVGEDWKERGVGGGLVPLGAEKNMAKPCVYGEKTGEAGEATRAASLIVLDGGSSSGKKRSAREQQ